MDSIHESEITPEKKVTYANMVCDFCPLKAQKYQVRLTVGGDCLEYMHDVTYPAASLIETKKLINSVISDSTRGARFFTLDIKDFFLQMEIQEHEFMQIHEKHFTKKLKDKYNLHNKITQDYHIYCRIKKGIYMGSNKQPNLHMMT